MNQVNFEFNYLILCRSPFVILDSLNIGFSYPIVDFIKARGMASGVMPNFIKAF